MATAKQAITKFCVPEEKLSSIIDVLNIFVDVIKMRESADSREAIDTIISKEVPKLELIPFYNFHKSALTLAYLQAISQKDIKPENYFVSQAIPSSIVATVPYKSFDFGLLRDKIIEYLEKG